MFENGVMDGEKAPFGKFAGSLRQKLMQEHLAFDTVKDCISETFYKDIWLLRASKNTKLYEEIFDCFPSDKVTNFKIWISSCAFKPKFDNDQNEKFAFFWLLSAELYSKGYVIIKTTKDADYLWDQSNHAMHFHWWCWISYI